HLDARRAHVDDEIRDPALVRGGRIRAGQAHAPVRELRVARPHLLAVQQPTVISGYGARAHRRQVAARAGLADQLAPQLARRADVRQPARLLLERPVGEQRRPDEVHADPSDQLRGARPRQLLGDDEVLDRARSPPAELGGPRHTDPQTLAELRLPVAPERDLVGQVVEMRGKTFAVLPREVLAQPGAHFGAEFRLGLLRLQVHPAAGYRDAL